jgi:hypothetical protein
MRDTDIRRALAGHLYLRHRDEPDTLIRHEFGICAGSRRVDVAVLNGEIAGYEIKSDEDTLARLAGQVEAYGRVFDRAVLVTTARHLDKAVSQLPDWWGVMTARPDGTGIAIQWDRHCTTNTSLDPFALAQLLWREEALTELRKRQLGRGLSKKARHYVWLALVDALPLSELRDVVRSHVKERPSVPGYPQLVQDGVRSRTPATE